MKIHVSREDIDLGLQQESTVCAIAVAIKRQVPGAKFIRVDQDHITFTDSENRERVTYDTPKRAAAFIDAFDNGKEYAHPFNLELRAGSGEAHEASPAVTAYPPNRPAGRTTPGRLRVKAT